MRILQCKCEKLYDCMQGWKSLYKFTFMCRTGSSSTCSTHQQDKILIFLSNRTSTHFMGLHLSCFNIHLAYCCFIITIIPTRLLGNWFYATRQNERQKNQTNKKRNQRTCRLKKCGKRNDNQGDGVNEKYI